MTGNASQHGLVERSKQSLLPKIEVPLVPMGEGKKIKISAFQVDAQLASGYTASQIYFFQLRIGLSIQLCLLGHFIFFLIAPKINGAAIRTVNITIRITIIIPPSGSVFRI
jgi:hypothetical protein